MTQRSLSAPSKPAPRVLEYRPIPAISPLPRTGVLLIGTAETVRSLAAQIGDLRSGVVLAGSILIPPPLRLADCAEKWVQQQHRIGLPSDLPVMGGLGDLPALHTRHRFKMAIVCLPRSNQEAACKIKALLARLGIESRFVPTFADLMTQTNPDTKAHTPGSESRATQAPAGGAAGYPESRATQTTFRAPPTIDLAALIGRKPYDLDRAGVARVLSGKRVLITGAGGSIGSHLAQVVAGFEPECLVLMDRSENSLFEIDRQSARRFPKINRRAILHDVVDYDQTLRILAEQRPQVVFHAAAHKHVPLMEDHPAHAVINNFFGTKSIADAAVASEAERFVMISSDKAVNPTSVMGATKRLAEVYVRSLGLHGGTNPTWMSMVRFGNVLGSACSVLTIWASQIAEGGPVTITDPRMTRYFMTIPEAATLVIQSTTIGGRDAHPTDGGRDAHPTDSSGPSGPVYVLDMGKPIEILELARRFIRAHGFEPRVQGEANSASESSMQVICTGARPGEKIHEEVAYSAELLRSTGYPGINMWAGDEVDIVRYTPLSIERMVDDLSTVRSGQDRRMVLEAIRRHVPEMIQTQPK